MKKLFVILSFLFLISCSVYQKYQVFNKSYSGENSKATAINDAYWWIDSYKSDTIPLDDWMTFQKYTDDGYMIERIFQKRWDDSTEVTILFKTFISDTISYNVSVIQRTKDKSLKKF